MLKSLAVGIVEWSWRRAGLVCLCALALSVLLGAYAASHLALDTDESKLISQDLPFRKAERAIESRFTHSTDSLVVVLDGPTAELAEQGVRRLLSALTSGQGPVTDARRPVEEMFFRRHGLMFLSMAELTEVTEKLAQAQPMLAAVARDPSLRGLLSVVDLLLQGIAHGQARPEDLEPLLAQLDKAARPLAQGKHAAPLDWQALMAAGPMQDQPRRVLLVTPKLDYAALEAGSAAADHIRAQAARLNLTSQYGYRLRLTGASALADANFATVAEGVELSGPLSVAMVAALLLWGVRSGRAVIAIMLSLAFGLVATAAFAAATVGSLNPISVAFAVLFVGIAVDFGIQFVTAFRAARMAGGDAHDAARAAAGAMASPLTLAALATALGFLSFLPTAYTGVSQLGLIAGGGMVIALIVDFTLLPALLALLKPKPEHGEVGLGLGWADRAVKNGARPILAGAVVIVLSGAALLPSQPTDFDPLHLQDPKAEAVATFLELSRDLDAGVYAIDTVAPSVDAIAATTAKFETMPLVRRVMSVNTFIPDDQDGKLALITDLAMLLGPTLSPGKVLPPPEPEELVRLLASLGQQLRAVAPGHALSQSLAGHLEAVAQRGPDTVLALHESASAGLAPLLDTVRAIISVSEPVTLNTLPPDLRADWVGKDGSARLRIVPAQDLGNQEARTQFTRAVQNATDLVAGPPVVMEESGKVVIRAFAMAGLGAVAAIALLLGIMLRRVLDSALVVAPLVVGAMATVLASRLLGLSLNFANVIALPLLLGVGVAFNIYYVVNWRSGVTDHLQSPTTRAVLFSALTTGSAFGSLAVSPHLGTASMGVLLFLSLALSVGATLVVLPALFHILGKPKS